MSAQTYYVPEQSRFPIFMAVSLFLLVMGASSTINNLDNPESNSVYILYAGFASLFTTLFFWFRQVIKEHLAGLDSNQLKTSYVYGMAWFIFSEVMFFAAFFGALFYVRSFAVPWLSGEGENGVGISAIGLWEGFESTWPVMTTPDKGPCLVLSLQAMLIQNLPTNQLQKYQLHFHPRHLAMELQNFLHKIMLQKKQQKTSLQKI